MRGLVLLFALFGWWQQPAPTEPTPPTSPQTPAAEGVAPSITSSLVFEGNTTFPTPRLERVLRRLEVNFEGPLDRTEVDDAAYFIQQFYFEQGFSEATVGYDYSAATRTGRILIQEGPVTYLGRVTFQGGEGIDQERLQDIVHNSLRISSRSLTARLRYVDEALWTAASTLQDAFARLGFLHALVDFSVQPGARPRTMDVEFTIDQGPLFQVRQIDFLTANPPQRGTPGTLEELDALQQLTAKLPNTPWTPDEAVLLSNQLTRHLHTLGYHRATVNVLAHLEETSGAVDLEIHVATGPLYRFGTISVTGSQRTFPAAIINRLGLRPGQTYDRSALLAGERRLWFSGAFADVRTELTEREDSTLDVDVAVEEGKARQIRGTIGYSQWERFFVNLSYTDRNFLGTLRELSIQGKYSFLGYGGFVRLADPMVFNSETTASILGFFLREELPGYDASFLGFSLGLSRQFNPPNLTGYELQYIWRSVFDVEVFGEGSQTAADEVNYSVGLIALSQTLDRRNNPLAPMQGFLLNYEIGLATQAFGGDLNFFLAEAQATYYLPLRTITPERPFVPFFVFNHRAGWLAPFANTGTLPTPERFFMGGPDSIRSFQLDGMGPRDADGDPIGGQLFWLLTGELQVPLFGPFYGVTFLDAANLAFTPSEYNWDDTRIALGLGARLYTPIGAVRLDYGYNLIRRDGDPIGAVLFGFGFTF